MPLQLVRNDITTMQVDAIVNPSDEGLSGSGGLDARIHFAAGEELRHACDALHGCRIGEAKITPGYQLACRYIIHTAGPVYKDGNHLEKEKLTACYMNALHLAKSYGCETVAIPLISSGTFGYPKAEALQTAVQAIESFLLENEMMVYLVIYDRKAMDIGEKLFAGIQAFINDTYSKEQDGILRGISKMRTDLVESGRMLRMVTPGRNSENQRSKSSPLPSILSQNFDYERQESNLTAAQILNEEDADWGNGSLEDALNQIDESFSQMLLRKIDEAGMKDSECYKRANIDRKLFSKIRSDIHYRPKKQTAIAFAIALHLSLDETKELLMKAGYALSHSNRFDIIIEYFIRQKNYNIFEINDALFAFDQPLLGG